MFRLSISDAATYGGPMPRLRRARPGSRGLRREPCDGGFAYVTSRGRPAPPPDVERIEALAIPPAWTDVWICEDPLGHLQATGVDAAGRRQYLYHPQWRAHRDRAKFASMLSFARALPSARRRVDQALDLGDLSHEHVSAVCVRLLDLGLFRVGGESYAQENGSHGLATLERRHAVIRGDTMVFSYRAKGGVDRAVSVSDERCARALATMKRRREAGDGLLAWRTGRRPAAWHDVTSTDVNEAVARWVEADATAKDFRTWHATVIAAATLADAPDAASLSQSARNRVTAGAMRAAAEALGNTPAVARSSYVDPRVVDLWLSGTVIATRAVPDGTSLLPADVEDTDEARLERAVVRLLSEE